MLGPGRKQFMLNAANAEIWEEHGGAHNGARPRGKHAFKPKGTWALLSAKASASAELLVG